MSPREDAVPPARKVARQHAQTAVDILTLPVGEPEGGDIGRRRRATETDGRDRPTDGRSARLVRIHDRTRREAPPEVAPRLARQTRAQAQLAPYVVGSGHAHAVPPLLGSVRRAMRHWTHDSTQHKVATHPYQDAAGIRGGGSIACESPHRTLVRRWRPVTVTDIHIGPIGFV